MPVTLYALFRYEAERAKREASKSHREKVTGS